jgi:SAM-dependent MidA family methyltransferase
VTRYELNTLTEIIKAEIRARGVISFARFMELALYCPDYGFYEKENDSIGRGGNFYTSVSVGPLFGQLLAFQFAAWLEAMPGDRVQIAEAGAHDGKLAADLLGWLKQHRPAVFERLEYVISEPSARRRGWQAERLRDFAAQVRWDSGDWAGQQSSGVIFANELLDAFPVHRLGWDAAAHQWFEWGVAVSDSGFVWAKLGQHAGAVEALCARSRLAELSAELLAVLPDGFATELCPAAEKWWCGAALALGRGRLLTLDYGLSAMDFFAPQRRGGTLRAYHQHKVSADVLANPGSQDLTAHVDFSAIRAAGESVGLTTEVFASQAEWLTKLAMQFWKEAEAAGEWTRRRARELQTLVHPEHLGRAFQVLVQARTA